MPLYPSPGAYDLLAERLIEGSTDGILVFDREQRYLIWNPALEQLFGLRADRVIGYRASEVFPQFSKTGMDRHYAAALAGEAISLKNQPFQMQETRRAGYVDIRYMPLANRYGYVMAVLGIVHDVTRKLRDEDARIRALAQQSVPIDLADEIARSLGVDAGATHGATNPSTITDDVLITTAHELRIPIDAILGYVELLTKGLSGPITPEQDDQLGRIATSARHLLVVANRVLGIAASEIDAGVEQPAVPPKRRKVSSAISPALTLVRPQAMARDIKLSSGVDEETDVWYYGDADWVTRIVVNLLSNAVKFTPAGGRVVVFAGEGIQVQGFGASTGRRTYIRVDDTGVGIAPEQLEAVFEPFVQGAPLSPLAGDLEQRGTGLGLTISRRLARQMGGDVIAASTPNSGSQFTLWLPADEPSLVQRPMESTTSLILPPPHRCDLSGSAKSLIGG